MARQRLNRPGSGRRYIPQEILNDDFSALDKANIFMLGASLYELASGTQLPTGLPERPYKRDLTASAHKTNNATPAEASPGIPCLS